MIVRKNINLKGIIGFSWFHMIWLPLWGILTACIYHFFNYQWLQIPWLPLSILGTAVAFYIGFKNNSAYDRVWEARKIWGAIVNSSRMWGSNIKAYVGNQFKNDELSDAALKSIHQRLIYRHIAWLYVLRDQLLIPTPWEHMRPSHDGWVKKFFDNRQKRFGIGLFGEEVTKHELNLLLEKEELNKVIEFQNTATQLIDTQSQELKKLRHENLIDDFRHMELQKILNDFYTHQGKCERIKKFPLPRQYGSMSFTSSPFL